LTVLFINQGEQADAVRAWDLGQPVGDISTMEE